MPIMGLEDESRDPSFGLKLTDIPKKVGGGLKKKVQEKAQATLWDLFVAQLKKKLGL